MKNGRRYNRVWLTTQFDKIARDPDYDGVSGNVYADFLEENGYVDAAEFLRKSFPVDDGKAK